MSPASGGEARLTDQEPKPRAKPQRVVKYIGTSDVRSISKAEWSKAGVKGQEDVVWNAENKFQVPASDLSEDALALLDPAEFKTPTD